VQHFNEVMPGFCRYCNPPNQTYEGDLEKHIKSQHFSNAANVADFLIMLHHRLDELESKIGILEVTKTTLE
jgi:hypothetical protein